MNDPIDELSKKYGVSLPKSNVDSILDRMRDSVVTQESGGNARAKNARTSATGLFQVLPSNIPSWTKKYLNKPYTPAEFANDPAAQEKVFRGEMGKYIQKALSKGVDEDTAIRMGAAAWYGGEGAMHRFDDPVKFRPNEPSFREYTSSILKRIKKAPQFDADGLSAKYGLNDQSEEPQFDDALFDKYGLRAAPVPEAPQTLAAQTQSVLDPASPKGAVLFTNGQERDVDPNLLTGLQRVERPEGVLYVHPQKAPDFANGSVAELIGKVDDVKDTSQGDVLVTTDEQGNELSSSIVTSQSAPVQAEVDRAMFPQAANQGITSVDDALKLRDPARFADVDNSAVANVHGGGAFPNPNALTPAPPQDVPEAYRNYLKETGLPDTNDTRKEFNIVQQTLSKTGLPTKEAAEKWLAEPAQVPRTTTTTPQQVKRPTEAPIAQQQPSDGGVWETPDWMEGGNARTQALDSTARKIASRLGVDYDIVRSEMDDLPGFDNDVAERKRKERKAIQIGLDAQAVKNVKARQADRAARKQKYEEALTRQTDANQKINQLQALAEAGLVPADEAQRLIDEERQAQAKVNEATGYTTSMEGIDQARFGLPGATLKSTKNALSQDEINGIIAEHGGFAEKQQRDAEIEEKYKYRPLARPSEFVLNLGRYFANIPATASKAIGIGVDAMSPVNIAPEKNPFIQFGRDWEERVNAAQNKDLKDELVVGDLSKGLGQLIAQGIMTPLTGGASLALPIAEAGVGQYEEAAKGGASRTQRLLATTIGGLAAVPDAVLKTKYLRALSPAGKSAFIDNLTKTLFSNLSKKYTEQEARKLTSSAITEFVKKAGFGAVGEGVQEYSEDAVNKSLAKLTYKPNLTWQDVFVPSKREMQGYTAASILGAFGGSFEAVTERMLDANIEKGESFIEQALKNNVITETEAMEARQAVNKEAEKRKISIKPEPKLEKTTSPVEKLEQSATEQSRLDALVMDAESLAEIQKVEPPVESSLVETDQNVEGEVKKAVKPQPLSNTQIEFSKEQSKPFSDFRSNIIDKADIADASVLPPYAKDGLHQIEPHVTVKYGLHTTKHEDVTPVLQGEKPIEVTLGKTSVFAGGEKKIPGTNKPVPYDVVIVEVESPDLARLNKKLTDRTENTTTFNDYKPHVTLAYVKPGKGKKYVGRTDFVGQKYTFDGVTFSPSDKSGKTVIPLSSGTAKSKSLTFIPKPAAAERQETLSFSEDKESRGVKVAKMAVERAKEERRKANTNPLTGLGSKNAWESAKERINNDPNQEIISLDVNRMKDANDTTSHDNVDTNVLAPMGKAVAKVLEKNGIDIRNAFSPGGDEAYVAVPKGKAEKIRDEIEKAFGTIEITAEKDYVNTRTGEKFSKGDIIPVTLSGSFGANLKEAEKDLGVRKEESKKANPVKRVKERDLLELKEPDFVNKPLAVKGLTSYRYQGRFGPIMIGAKDDADAINEANRSLEKKDATLDKLEVWDGSKYVPVKSPDPLTDKKKRIAEKKAEKIEDKSSTRTPLPADVVRRVIAQSPEPDFDRFIRATVRDFAPLINNRESISPQELADRVAKIHDLGNKKTFIAYSALKNADPNMVITGKLEGNYVRGRHRGNSVTAEVSKKGVEPPSAEDRLENAVIPSSDSDEIAKRARSEIQQMGESFTNATYLKASELMEKVNPKNVKDEGDGVVSLNDVPDYELIRRLLSEWEKANNPKGYAPFTNFDGQFLDAKQISQVLSILDKKSSDAGQYRGKLSQVHKTIKQAASLNKGVIFVMAEEALPEEVAHRSLWENRRASRQVQISGAVRKSITASEAFQRALKAPFGSNYKNASPALKVEEFFAKVVTKQYDEIGAFSEDERAQAISEAIDFAVDFAKTNEGEKTKGEIIQSLANNIAYVQELKERIDAALESGEVQGEPKTSGDVAEDGPVQPPERGEGEAASKNRKHAEYLRRHGLDIEDVPYIPETERGWQQKGRQIVEESLKNKGDYSEAIEQFENPQGLTGGERTALAYELIDRLGSEGDYAQMNKIAEGIVVEKGQAGASLRAAQLVSKYDFAGAVEHVKRILDKEGKPLRDKDIDRLRRETAHYAHTEEELAQAIELYETVKAEKELIEAEAEEIRQALNNSEEKRVVDEKQIANLRRQVSYWKNKKIAESRPKRTAKYKELDSKRDLIMDKIRQAFGDEAAKSVVTFDETAKSARTDEETRNALVDYAALKILEHVPYKDVIADLKDITGLSQEEMQSIHADAVESVTERGKSTSNDAAKIRHEHKREAKKYRDGGLDLNRLDREVLKGVTDPQLVFATLLWNRALNAHDFKTQIKKEFNLSDKEANDLLKDVGQRREQAKQSLRRQMAEKRQGQALSDKELQQVLTAKRVASANARKAKQSLDQTFRKLQMSTKAKIAEGAMEAVNFLKGTAATGEISYLLRQGLLPLITDTRLALKGDYEGVGQGLRSEEDSTLFIEKIREHARLNEAQAFGVRFTDVGDHNIADEHFSSRVLESIPGYKRLELAYTLPGDLQRLYLFDAYSGVIEGQGLSYEEQVEAKKYAAKVVNALTGKGDIGTILAKGGALSKMLNVAFFSPSLLMSRFQSAYYLTAGFATAPKGMRLMMAKKGLRAYTILGLTAYLLGMSLDPDDDDFGKVRRGDLQYQPLAGMDLPLELMFRAAGGMFKWLKTGDQGHFTDQLSEMWQKLGTNKRNEPRFLRGKLSPAASWLADYGTGTDYIGRPYTHWGAISSRLFPLSWGQTYDALVYDRFDSMMKEPVTIDRAKHRMNDNERDWGNMLSIMVPTFIGIGVQQYPKGEMSPATKKAGEIRDYVPRKDGELLRVEGGLRSMIREKLETEARGESTAKADAEIKKYATKYADVMKESRVGLKGLASQAKSKTGLLSFYASQLSSEQIQRVLPLADHEEREVLLRILKKKD